MKKKMHTRRIDNLFFFSFRFKSKMSCIESTRYADQKYNNLYFDGLEILFFRTQALTIKDKILQLLTLNVEKRYNS